MTKLTPTAPHEVSFEDVRARDAFLRWSVPATAVTGCWATGSGVALVHRRPPRPMLPSPWAVLLGQPADLRPLIDALPDLVGTQPRGVTMSAEAYHLVPAAWGLGVRGHWDYMATTTVPEVPGDPRIEVVTDHDAINAVLDADNADAHARPGDPDVDCWMGIADDSGMACVGALTMTHNGGGHLRAITTLERARGRGHGASVSVALTRRGLERLSPEVTLGVYSDNAGAIRLYERLGYRRVHRFTSAALPVSCDEAVIC